MLSTSARLLDLLGLLQGRRDWSGAALAQRLAVDVRTVRRDVDRLRELGYRVDASAGQGGGYRLGNGAQLPPVLLGDDEAITVMLALRAASGSVAGLDAISQGLMAKLDHLLPTRLRSRLRAFDDIAVSLPGRAVLAEVEALALVAAACRDRLRLRLAYVDREGRRSERRLEPLQLVHTGRRWYLMAFDLGREDWRTFRMDRVADPVLDGSGFAPRTPPDEPARFVARAIANAPAPFQLRVRLRGSMAELAESVPCWCGRLEALDDGHAVLEIGAASVDGIVSLLALVGRPFEILDAPPWRPQLDAALAQLAASLTRPPLPAA